MVQLIACDLDETLIKLDRTIDPKDIEAIRALKKVGIKFVPTTGRGYLSIQGTLKKLGLYDEAGEYVISFNGGAITENQGNRLLHFEGISFDQAQELYHRGQQYDVCIHVYTKEMVYIYQLTRDEKAYLANRMAIQEIASDNLDFLKGQEIVKVLYVNTDQTYLNQIEKDLSDLTPKFDVSYSSNRYLEFNHRGVNKGEALLTLAEILDIDPADIIAIGDNDNDLPMIRAAGLGVGVQNAVESVKQACDYVTDATCDEGAVSETIRKFVC